MATQQTSQNLNTSGNKMPREEIELVQKIDPKTQQQFSKKQQQETQQTNQEFRNDDMDYEQRCGFFSQLFFINLLLMAVKIKKALQKGLTLSIPLIPKIKEADRVQRTSASFFKDIQILQQSNQLKPFNIFRKVLKYFNKEICWTIFVLILDATFKLFNSIALNLCIQEIINGNQDKAFGWGGAVVGSMYLSATSRHRSWLIGQNAISVSRLLFVDVIYKKISKLSAHSIKEANLGKVINLVSSDLNSTELKGFFLFNMFLSPFILIAVCFILYFRLGPYGLLSVLLLTLVFPIQSYFGKKSSVHIQSRTGKSDERIKLINEAIEGIRLIKMYGWEDAFRMMIDRTRNEEVASSISSSNYQNAEKAISKCLVLLVASIVFSIVHYTGYELNTAKLFSTIEMLQYLRVNVMFFSGVGFGYIFELKIFLNRFIDIIQLEEKDMVTTQEQNQIEDVEAPNQPILPSEMAHFTDFQGFWKQPPLNKEKNNLATETAMMKEKKYEQILPALKNVNLSISKGELLGIVGKIGSGKSTFLQCFLREIPYYEGKFHLASDCKMCYVEQEPYIFSDTVRENILFGKQYDEQWYKTVVEQCCLLPDFQEMQKEDMTLIGERGINISGGQKARISLARAVYSKADLYLFDDPLSAVDSKVAEKLFNTCIKKLLKGKTVILVTHQIHYTKDCDRVILFEEGQITKLGNFDEMEEELKKLSAGQLKFENSRKDSQAMVIVEKSEEEKQKEEEEKEKQEAKKRKEAEVNKLKEKKPQENLQVTSKTYFRFINLISQEICGFKLILVIVFIGSEVLFTAFNRGLGYYDSTQSKDKGKLFGYLFGTAFGFLIINIFKNIFLNHGILVGSRRLHSQMFKALSRAPTLYFDITPSGQLMNNFSNDISIVDNALSYSANDAIDILCYLSNLMITCCVINPYVIIPAFFEIFIFYKFLIYSKDLIIKTKVLDLTYKSPVFQFFQSTLQGLIPMKIYDQTENFMRKMMGLCDNCTQANIIYWLTGRFFGVFVQYVAITGSAVGIFIIISNSSDNPGLAGQSLTYFMMMTDSIQWCLRQILNLDSVMSSCERGFHLIDASCEAPLITQYDMDNQLVKNTQTPASSNNEQIQKKAWPSRGELEFKDVVMKYSNELNPVLKGVSFQISAGQKVGCIGRTGAGKSSILQALFRMTEVENSSLISLDGQDISKLGLHTLRKNISIIPQVPFVFAGTIRRNLDPLGEHTDDQLWESLQLVEIDTHIKNNCPKQLDTDMTNVQSVFSVGQKQLICLARAILKRNKLIVLDEATANVDMETDNLIQKTIRNKFSSSTVLTIAHRLNTIADYDKVIVMDQGKVAEFDQPFLLLANNENDTQITKNTLFAQMVNHTGKNNSANIFSNAKAKYLKDKK